MVDLTWQALSAQALGLVALGLCMVAFSSKHDDRLLFILVAANVAFALHFALLGSWTAAALTALIIVRIQLARRCQGSIAITGALLAASGLAAALTWQGPTDVLPLTASTLGTLGMFLLRGIPMRLLLAGAALAWTLNNILIGSLGGTLAEILILVTNAVTVVRLARTPPARPCAASTGER